MNILQQKADRDENLEEQPHKRQKLKTHTNDTNICSGIERGCNDTHRNNEIIAKPHTSEVVCSVPVENSSSPLLDESPRKDFSIAGLLSPNQENTLSSQTEIKSETACTPINYYRAKSKIELKLALVCFQ